MISTLASPSICVIDEDEKDFRPILDALNGLYLGCVHIRGDSTDHLPEKPFKELRLVFTDLYLSSGAVGKDMASHTANVFRHVVSPDAAPLLVVIWSKHAGEKTVDLDVPPEDQETEAELFKRILLEAEPKYKGRLLFIEMAKRRTEDWVPELKSQINKLLEGQEAVHALWLWESLVRQSSLKVSEELTAHSVTADSNETLKNLKEALQLLTQAQKEGSTLTPEVAPHYLSVVLGQLLADQLEHADGLESFAEHGDWLALPCNGAKAGQLAPVMNSLLLTAEVPSTPVPMLPGTVYMVCDNTKIKEIFGIDCDDLVTSLYKKDKAVALEEWKNIVRIVMLELSPSCDIDNGTRVNSILLAGVVLPSNAISNAKGNAGAFRTLPIFSLRKEIDGFAKQDVSLSFSSLYKVTLPATTSPEWLNPWFRLRELPTADLRNWYASHASRVGFVSL